MAKPESKLKKEIINHLRNRYDALVFRLNSGRRGGVDLVRWYLPGNVYDVIDPQEILQLCQPKNRLEFLSSVNQAWTRGASDILAWSPFGWCAAFELKSPTDSAPTGEQLLFLEVVRRMGWIAGVVGRIEDVDDLVGTWPGRGLK